jgi:type IV pilus assembly protein PilZ
MGNEDFVGERRMGEEKRKDPRADVQIEIQYQTDREFLAAYTKNISGGGVFIRTSQPLSLNQKVALRFTLPSIDHQFEIGGLVVWVNSSPRGAFPVGMGIKFLEIKPADADAVAEFVRNTGGEGSGLDQKG